uniref:Uncharacterized protein n=1 Tax=Anguilla anguilla TaxID=7936 RepID=A0A0E9XG67_ANGAN
MLIISMPIQSAVVSEKLVTGANHSISADSVSWVFHYYESYLLKKYYSGFMSKIDRVHKICLKNVWKIYIFSFQMFEKT